MVPAPVPPQQPLELSPAHLERLQALTTAGFELVRFPFFEAHLGVRKYGCAALLKPQPGGELTLAVAPSYLVEGNLSALVERGGEQRFIWKAHQVAATPERLALLRRFEEELRALLATPPMV